MSTAGPDLPPETVEKILNAVKSLRFGSVEVTVHAGRVVQIEKKEKVRLAESETRAPRSSPSEAFSEPSTAGKKPVPK